MSKYIPNSFQTPNIVVDELMSLLNSSELKCYLFAIRHVYGWQDKIERGYAHISISMFEHGFSQFSGTGLSRPTITKSLKTLAKYGLLIKVETDETNSKGQAYAIGENPDIEGLEARNDKDKKDKNKDGVVKNFNQKGLNNLTSGSKKSLPKQTQEKTQDNIPPENSDGVEPSSKPTITRERKPDFDWVIENIFNITGDASISKQVGRRAGKCLRAIKAIHTANDTELTVYHLNQFKAWYRDNYTGQIMPRDDSKLSEYYAEFYARRKSQQQQQPSATVHYTSDWINQLK